MTRSSQDGGSPQVVVFSLYHRPVFGFVSRYLLRNRQLAAGVFRMARLGDAIRRTAAPKRKIAKLRLEFSDDRKKV